MVLSTEWAQVEVVELSNDGNGLGFHLVGGRSTGVVVKHVVPGGAADHDGRLQPGDHLLQVGEVNVRGLSAEQVAGVVRGAGGGSGGGARLLVARRGVGGATAPPGTALVPTRLLHDAAALHAHLVAAAAPAPPPAAELLAVRLRKNVYGLGITVAGYVCEREDLCGLFVRSIIEGSSAERSAVRVNDRIVAVDGVSLLALSNPQAVAVLRATGLEVELLLERHLRGPKFEHLRLAAFPDERVASPDVSAASLTWFPVPSEPEVSAAPDVTEAQPAVKTAEPGIELDLESTTTIDSGVLETDPAPADELDPAASAEAVSRWLDALLGESAAALQARWAAALGARRRVLVADVRRGAGGLGLSVEGTAQVVRGRERRARHYVRGLRAGGAAAAAGARGGDELLQANARVLRGVPHAAAVAALRALPSAARLVLARGAARPPPAPDPHHSPPADMQDRSPSPDSLSDATPPSASPLPQENLVPPKAPESPVNESPISIIMPDSPVRTSTPQLLKEIPVPIVVPDSTVRPSTPQLLTESPVPIVFPDSPVRPCAPQVIKEGPVPTVVPDSPAPPSTPPALHVSTPPTATPTLPPSATTSPPTSPLPSPVSGLALWHSEEEIVELEKGAQGLGFSILDYQDPLDSAGTCIVVRGVVAGGAAAAAGRPRRGERVLSVGGRSVRGASLAAAVAALKAAPPGRVRLGLARAKHTPPPSPPDH